MTPKQQERFNAILRALNIEPKDAQSENFSPQSFSISVEIENPDQLQQLMAEQPIVNNQAQAMELFRWPSHKNNLTIGELTQSERQELQRALWLTILGQEDQVPSYQHIIRQVFFPIKATLLCADEVTIKAGEVKVIPESNGGHDPYIVNWGTLNLEEGGQIQCDGPVILNIQQFNKTAAS